MLPGMEGPHAEGKSVGSKGNRSRVLSQGFRCLEKEWRREQDNMQDGHETRVDLDEGFS